MCSCQFQCGELSCDEKRRQFGDFYKLDYNGQSAFLAKACIKVGEVNRRRVSEDISKRHCTVQYFIPRKDNNVRVCRKTLCAIFNVTPRRVQILVDKIKFDKTLSDGRGLHGNHPHKVTDETKDLIRQQIRLFHCRKTITLALRVKKIA